MNISYGIKDLSITNVSSYGKTATKQKKTEEMRHLLNNLHRETDKEKNPYGVYVREDFGKIAGVSETNKEKRKATKKKFTYNPNEVANKIRQSKTSLNASQAVRSARKKVSEIKRKLATADESDSADIQSALIHASRMELVAKQKKRHLEQEEMVKITMDRDERMEEKNDSAEDIRLSEVQAAEEEAYEKEDEIFEARQEMIDEMQANIEETTQDGTEEMSEEMLSQMNLEIASLGEDLLEDLEETLDMLSEMEILNPHMSKEKFEKIKTKHRNDEEKAILKANMDYLKATMKQASGAEMKMGAMTGGTSNMAQAMGMSVATTPSVSIDIAM